jgi:hypothetical protein
VFALQFSPEGGTVAVGESGGDLAASAGRTPPVGVLDHREHVQPEYDAEVQTRGIAGYKMTFEA